MSLAHRNVRVRISGRVQGVWFRAWTVREAQARRLSGWVRNLRGGDVEAHFSGPASAVEAMIEACRKGPPAARVGEIRVEESTEAPGEGFRQIADA